MSSPTRCLLPVRRCLAVVVSQVTCTLTWPPSMSVLAGLRVAKVPSPRSPSLLCLMMVIMYLILLFLLYVCNDVLYFLFSEFYLKLYSPFTSPHLVLHLDTSYLVRARNSCDDIFFCDLSTVILLYPWVQQPYNLLIHGCYMIVHQFTNHGILACLYFVSGDCG